jgi:hypothetical protein
VAAVPHPNWAGLERLYASFSRHPFAFGEIGIYQSGDDPGYVSRLLRWSRTHSRVRMLLWMQGNSPGDAFRVQRNPASLRVLRAALRSPVFQAYPWSPPPRERADPRHDGRSSAFGWPRR